MEPRNGCLGSGRGPPLVTSGRVPPVSGPGWGGPNLAPLGPRRPEAGGKRATRGKGGPLMQGFRIPRPS